MSIWIISDKCTIDDNSNRHEVIKDGIPIHLRPQCWLLLNKLLEAKKRNGTLTFDNIGEILWGKYGGWDDARKDSLNKIIGEIRQAIGLDSIGNTYGTGYYLTYEIRQISVPTINNNEYYERLWKNHYKGTLRDQVATGMVRELIDFFVVPSITKKTGEEVSKPFSGSGFSKFVMAGSGFGKSTLLDILLLCNVIDPLLKSESKCLSNNSREKTNDYFRVKESLCGASSVSMFPVFIHSDEANTRNFNNILELAEASDIESFVEMVNDANCNGTLLFLIDSIDEVESKKYYNYINAIKKMLADYPNASVVFASRFLGKKLPFEYDLIHIKELKSNAINKIASSMLSKSETQRFITRLEKNEYYRSLAKNPFMLMTMLETKGDRLVHHLLESIVNAIIERRWNKRYYDISSEDLKLLLGFLACEFVFEDKSYAGISEIRQCFITAGDNLKLHGVSYDVPSKNIDYFLNTLSSQSGILNIDIKNHIEMYMFQDELIMCWLAANYINRIINESTDIHDREGINGIWANVYWIDNYIRSFSKDGKILSSDAVYVLVMLLVMSSETNGQDIQKSILYFLVCRDATSLHAQEQRNICNGYRDIVKNAFGVNDITNRQDSDSLKLIYKMLEAHTKESDDELLLDK